MKSQLFKWIALILLLFLTVFISYHLMKSQGLTHLATVLEQYSIAFTLWRYGLLASVLLSWPFIVRRYAKAHEQNEAWVKTMLQLRTLLILLFAVVELFIAHNGFGYLVGRLLN